MVKIRPTPSEGVSAVGMDDDSDASMDSSTMLELVNNFTEKINTPNHGRNTISSYRPSILRRPQQRKSLIDLYPHGSKNLFRKSVRLDNNIANLTQVSEIRNPKAQLSVGDEVFVGTRLAYITKTDEEMVYLAYYDDDSQAKIEFISFSKVSSKIVCSQMDLDDDVPIPSWSLQDRSVRIEVRPGKWSSFFQSNVPIGILFFLFFSIQATYSDPSPSIIAWEISCFIFLQTLFTLCIAVPSGDSSNEEVNNSVNASMLISMILYPCLGLILIIYDGKTIWQRFQQALRDIYFAQNKEDVYQWGYILPFFLFLTKACILIRDSNFAFTLDRKGVITNCNGKPVTALFRRNPFPVEVWSHKITKTITSSLWDVLPDNYRPAGGAGRFAFQLVAPYVALFYYTGYYMVHFALKKCVQIISDSDVLFRYADEQEKATAIFILWTSFTLYCVAIRGLVGTHRFLSAVVTDKESCKKRWVGWAPMLVESKRRHVLCAFRGWTLATVQYYCSLTNSEGASKNEISLFFGILYYLLVCVYVSYFMEGLSAFFFVTTDAEKGCGLRTPFKLMTDLFAWGAYNSFLQPIGTVVNAFFYLLNGEYLMNLHLLEVFSPLLLTERNTLRFECFCCSTSKNQLPKEIKLDERLQEWLATWRRKRADIGRDAENYTVQDLDPDQQCPIFTGPIVFFGTMFPTYHEWLYMRDNHEKYVEMLPWDHGEGPEKFNKWYPTYREEVLKLLREPYDFEIRREVWMFGYGSLISPNSPPAGLTHSQQKQIIPYWLKKQAGYRRTWNYRHGPVSINAFGLEKVKEKDGMNICGCIYPMDYEKASDLFSIREEGYELLIIHEDFFEPMHIDFTLPKGIGYVWVCGQPTLKCGDSANKNCSLIECKRHEPTKDSPILQSYIDTIMVGALRFNTAGTGYMDGQRFAASILSSTTGWNAPWFNDRIISGRPWTFAPKYELIDGLLSTCPTSRNGFANRTCTSNQILSEKKPMLEEERDANLYWANEFFGIKN